MTSLPCMLTWLTLSLSTTKIYYSFLQYNIYFRKIQVGCQILRVEIPYLFGKLHEFPLGWFQVERALGRRTAYLICISCSINLYSICWVVWVFLSLQEFSDLNNFFNIVYSASYFFQTQGVLLFPIFSLYLFCSSLFFSWHMLSIVLNNKLTTNKIDYLLSLGYTYNCINFHFV